MNTTNQGASSRKGGAAVKIIRGLREAQMVEALRHIAFLRPAGDVSGVKLKDAHRLIETMERTALDALGEGL